MSHTKGASDGDVEGLLVGEDKVCEIEQGGPLLGPPVSGCVCWVWFSLVA
jgi:hypothetical protein